MTTAPDTRDTLTPVRPPRISTGTVFVTAALWSGLYAVAALAWALGAPGFPFGPENDPEASSTLLSHAGRGTAAAIALVAATATALAAVLTRPTRRTPPTPSTPLTPPTRRPLPTHTGAPPTNPVILPDLTGQAPEIRCRSAVIAVSVLLATVLAVLLPDFRILARLGYLPIFLVGAPFGWPKGISYLDSWTWPVLNQAICLAGGLLWAAVAVRLIPGRDALLDTARRWSGRATAVAVIVPLLYAAERIAWSLGIPLGADQALVDELASGDGRWAALGLGAGAVAGAVLTLGLVQRWGTVFPFWLPGLRGRRVPPGLAVVPAGLVAVTVTAAGVTVLRLALTGAVPEGAGPALLPMALWPLWGLGLAVATVGYHRRRQRG